MADDEKSLTPTEDLREIGDDASVEKDAAGITAQAPDDLQRKLTFSRRLNVFLGVAAAFLLVIAIAQPLSQSNPPVNPAARETPAATTPETDDDSGVPPEASASADAAGPDRPALAIQLAKADPNDPMAFGDINAPLTVIEWTDYRCPFCAKFTNDTMPELLKTYVDEGLVRYEIRDVSFFGEESTAAAVAVRAAGEQGKFAEYFEAVYAAAPESGHPDMGVDRLVEFAKTAGVADIAKFTADLKRADLAEAVAQSTVEAQQIGINSVPFFVVGNTHFSGAQPIDVFHSVFEEQLELARAAQ